MLYYESFGNQDPSAPLIIFLHGFLGSRLDWIEVIYELQKEYHCIALDLPSHGKSPYSKDVLASLETTIDSITSTPCIIVGYSMGGRLLFSYTKKNPEKVKIALAISAHIGLLQPHEKQEKKLSDLTWAKRLQTLSCDDFLHLWYQQPIFSSLQKRPLLLQSILKKRSNQNQQELALILEQMSLSKQPLSQNFQRPTYFLFGEEDEKYKNLYTPFSDSIKTEIKDAGHVVHLENPTAVALAIRAIIQKEKKDEYTANLDSCCKT